MNLNDLFNEEKVRLDPKCWTGKKIGNPKTKMKGGTRVNNCVPAESVNEMDKSQTPPGRDGSTDSDAGKKEYTAKAITPKKAVKDGEKILNKVLNKKQGVAEGLNTGPQIIYATGPRTMGTNDVDLVFKDLRTGKIVAHVVGNNNSLQEFALPDGGEDGGNLPERPATYEIRMNNSKAPTYVAFGDPNQDSEYKVYKLGPKQPGAQAYYGMGITLVSNLDWWSFLEKMLGEIMAEDDAIESGLVDRKGDGDLVFVKQQGVAEEYELAGVGVAYELGRRAYKERKTARDNPYSATREARKNDEWAKGLERGKHDANDARHFRSSVREQAVAEDQLDEKSVSQAQFRTMAAAAHNPEFAKKVGISRDVAKEFHSADKSSNYKKLPDRTTEGWKDVVAGGALALGALGAGAQTMPNMNVQQVELANKYYNALVQRATEDGRELDTRTLNFLKAKAQDAAALKLQQASPQKQQGFPTQGSERRVAKDAGQFESQGMAEGKPKEKEADYGDNYQDMVARVKKLAGLGPLKTVYDPTKRVYRNVPTAVQPKK